jgi:hypothetical protein
MNTGVLCIAKDEDNYIAEWVDYHTKLGFDNIYMFQNDWICPIDRPNLIKFSISGQPMQLNAYNYFLENHAKNIDWLAVIDCDEFIFLKKHKNVKELFQEYDNPYGLALNWTFFGGCDKKTRDENNKNSILKQFTHRQVGLDQHIKSIIKPSANGRFYLPHNPTHHLMDLDRKHVSGPFNRGMTNDIAYIGHFHHKTYEDWLIRCNRGRADGSPKQHPEDWSNPWTDMCVIEDTIARDFMYS